MDARVQLRVHDSHGNLLVEQPPFVVPAGGSVVVGGIYTDLSVNVGVLPEEWTAKPMPCEIRIDLKEDT